MLLLSRPGQWPPPAENPHLRVFCEYTTLNNLTPPPCPLPDYSADSALWDSRSLMLSSTKPWNSWKWEVLWYFWYILAIFHHDFYSIKKIIWGGGWTNTHLHVLLTFAYLQMFWMVLHNNRNLKTRGWHKYKLDLDKISIWKMKRLGCQQVKSPNSHRNFLTELGLLIHWPVEFFHITPRVII